MKILNVFILFFVTVYSYCAMAESSKHHHNKKYQDIFGTWSGNVNFYPEKDCILNNICTYCVYTGVNLEISEGRETRTTLKLDTCFKNKHHKYKNLDCYLMCPEKIYLKSGLVLRDKVVLNVTYSQYGMDLLAIEKGLIDSYPKTIDFKYLKSKNELTSNSIFEAKLKRSRE